MRSPPRPLLLCLDQRHSFPSNHRRKQGLVRRRRGGSKSKHLTEEALVEVLLSKGAVPGAPAPQYSLVPGTELALVVIGNPVGPTHRAEVFLAEQHHFALLAGCVGVPAAIHLGREQSPGEGLACSTQVDLVSVSAWPCRTAPRQEKSFSVSHYENSSLGGDQCKILTPHLYSCSGFKLFE